ncbi:hypothetical protein DJ480_01850 [Pseudomonas sp. Leaf98]|nr:hypothetical protein DJ480_01850 [Pseudomonas sp. Leaf98]
MWMTNSAQFVSADLSFYVGAGLPAMRLTRYIRHTELMPSQASQLPQPCVDTQAGIVQSA